MRLPLFLALKYLKPKRSVASAITVVSVLGVMLGVAAVLVVRSVMTGFGEIWEEKILDFKPHVTLLPTHGNVIGGEDALAPPPRPRRHLRHPRDRHPRPCLLPRKGARPGDHRRRRRRLRPPCGGAS